MKCDTNPKKSRKKHYMMHLELIDPFNMDNLMTPEGGK